MVDLAAVLRVWAGPIHGPITPNPETGLTSPPQLVRILPEPRVQTLPASRRLGVSA
jgi:hypothetical protein